jgi:enoyl-[acyl-carrier protein] reductase II
MKMRLNPLSALLRSREIARLLGLPWFKLAAGIVLSGYRRSVQMARMAIGFDAFKKGCTEGDVERGVLPLGQCTGLINDTPTVAEVISRSIAEAEDALGRVAG